MGVNTLKYATIFYTIGIICVAYYLFQWTEHRNNKHVHPHIRRNKHATLILLAGLISCGLACVMIYQEVCTSDTRGGIVAMIYGNGGARVCQ